MMEGKAFRFLRLHFAKVDFFQPSPPAIIDAARVVLANEARSREHFHWNDWGRNRSHRSCSWQMVDASIEPRPPVLMWPCTWHACIAWHIRGALNVGILWNSWKLVHFLVLQKTTTAPGCGGAYAASLWKEATFWQQNSANGLIFPKLIRNSRQPRGATWVDHRHPGYSRDSRESCTGSEDSWTLGLNPRNEPWICQVPGVPCTECGPFGLQLVILCCISSSRSLRM